MPLWFGILTVIAIACLFVWYIYPDRASSPSVLRKYMAIFWVVLRRIVCFSAAALGLFIIYIVLTSNEEITLKLIFTLVISLVLLSGFVFIGIVGFAKDESMLDLYKRIKKKYGLRW